jgi:glycosyltransferase involved in cell wall biosynthesis
VTKLVKYLSRLGWQITVVCSDEPAGETDDPALLDEIPDHVHIVRLRGPLRSVGAAARGVVEGTRSRRGGGRVWDGARAAARAFAVPDRWIGWSLRVGKLTAAEVGHPDVIVSSGPPHSVHLAARSLSRRFGVPFVMDLRDDWAGNPLFASRAPWRDPIDRRLERRAVRGSRGLVVVSDASRDLYRRRYQASSARIHVIPNGFDPEDLPDDVVTRVVPGPDQPVRFLHAGSLRYARRGGESFFDAFGRSARTDPTLVLHLLGSVSPSHAAQAQAAIPEANLSLDGFVPHEEALRRMAMADVLVVISSVSEAGTGAFTSKIFECLAVQRPILLISPPGPAVDLIEAAGIGVTVGPDDAASIADAIAGVAGLVRSRKRTAAPDEVLVTYDRSKHATTWSAILDRVVSDGRHRPAGA